MTLSEAIRTRITELMKIKNINVNQLAIACGVSDSTIRNILKIRCNTPNTKTLFLICIGFNITVSEFYNSNLFDFENIEDI